MRKDPTFMGLGQTRPKLCLERCREYPEKDQNILYYFTTQNAPELYIMVQLGDA